jgi:hypothetical protein
MGRPRLGSIYFPPLRLRCTSGLSPGLHTDDAVKYGEDDRVGVLQWHPNGLVTSSVRSALVIWRTLVASRKRVSQRGRARGPPRAGAVHQAAPRRLSKLEIARQLTIGRTSVRRILAKKS